MQGCGEETTAVEFFGEAESMGLRRSVRNVEISDPIPLFYG